MPQNQMMVNGQTATNTAAYLTVNLADDNAEVRGFGQIITRDRTRQLAENYFKACEKAEVVIKEIDSNSAFLQLKQMSEYTDLKKIIEPVAQTVSGVFGKEIILQILAMKGCEGIRYIMGHYGKQSTVILIGVMEKGVAANGTTATSAPVELKSTLRLAAGINDQPIDGEVHGHSMTIDDVRQMLSLRNALAGNAVDALLDEF